jgi:hypothetical protein
MLVVEVEILEVVRLLQLVEQVVEELVQILLQFQEQQGELILAVVEVHHQVTQLKQVVQVEKELLY